MKEIRNLERRPIKNFLFLFLKRETEGERERNMLGNGGGRGRGSFNGKGARTCVFKGKYGIRKFFL